LTAADALVAVAALAADFGAGAAATAFAFAAGATFALLVVAIKTLPNLPSQLFLPSCTSTTNPLKFETLPARTMSGAGL